MLGTRTADPGFSRIDPANLLDDLGARRRFRVLVHIDELAARMGEAKSERDRAWRQQG